MVAGIAEIWPTTDRLQRRCNHAHLGQIQVAALGSAPLGAHWSKRAVMHSRIASSKNGATKDVAYPACAEVKATERPVALACVADLDMGTHAEQHGHDLDRFNRILCRSLYGNQRSDAMRCDAMRCDAMRCAHGAAPQQHLPA